MKLKKIILEYESLKSSNCLQESKQDELNFKNWLNNDEYANLFLKFRQSFKQPENDYYYWIKKKQPKDLIKFIDDYQNQKSSKDKEHQEIMQGAEYIGEGNGYKVYYITTWEASKTLGQGAKWCISMKDNSGFWNNYTSKGIKFYFFISSQTKYALALYPKTLDVDEFIDDNTYVIKTNFEIFNAKDNLDYESINILPINLIPENVVIDKKVVENGLIIEDSKIIKAVPDIKTCKIPTSITSIGNFVFDWCTSLTSITIPDSVTSIADSAFYGCSNLESITIPNSVTSIGDSAFYHCTSLTSITLPNSVTSIGDYAFDNSTSLVVYSNNEYVKQYCSENEIQIKPLKNESHNEEFNRKRKKIIESKQEQALVSNGIYSVMQNKWLKEPIASDIPEIDEQAFEELYEIWEDKYFEAVESNDVEIIKDFIEDIYDLRKESIANEGEYGLGNLLFKEFRNLGFLDNLKDLKNVIKSKELSLEALKEELVNNQEVFWHMRNLVKDLFKEYDFNNLYLDGDVVKPIPDKLLKNKFSVSCEQARDGELVSRDELEAFKEKYDGEYIVFFLANDDKYGGEYSIIVSDEKKAQQATRDYNQDGYAWFKSDGSYGGTRDANGKELDESILTNNK